jgi:hypothetical protein
MLRFKVFKMVTIQIRVFRVYSALMIETPCFSEMLVTIYELA